MLKKLIGLGVAFMLVLGVTTGTSWAYFRDTETSTGNTITAGTLDLVPLESGSYTGGSPSLYVVTPGGNGINGNVVFDKMAPGQSGTIEWVLHNTGSLSGTLTTSLSGVFALAASPGEPKTLVPGYFANPNGYLGTYVMVTLQKGVGANQAAAESALATGYINAGHNTPFHLIYSSDVIEPLGSTGSVLGPSPNQEYKIDSFYFNKYDTLILYTDGVVEAVNGKFEFFGEDRLKQELLNNKHFPAREIAANIMSTVQKFSARGKYSDDKTIVVIKRIK